jgi:hypothetical protein
MRGCHRWAALLAAACGVEDAGGVGTTEAPGSSGEPTTSEAGPRASDASSGAPDSSDDGPPGSEGEASSASGEDSSGGNTGSPGAWCQAPPTCLAPLPDAGPTLPWNESESSLVVLSGAPTHRGRDMFYGPDDAQWVLAKFGYGLTDWDLSGERVDLFLLRDCTGEWEPLGSVQTTSEGAHDTVEGVEDTGGRIYFELTGDARLGPGRHRVHAVVRGDDSRTDVMIEIVPSGTPVFVSDVDGTLTTSETEEFTDLLVGDIPAINTGAPEVMWALVEKGYHPFYLTARPEFLGARTQEFVRLRGLPPGIVHTTLSFTGALGDAAIDYKSAELAALAARGLVPDFAFGNTDSDAAAYEAAGVQPLQQRVFFQFDDPHGGRRIDDYFELVPELAALPDLCGR